MRLTALAAAAATLLAVVSRRAPGFEHRLLAALALPPLVALVVAGRLARPRLLAPSLVALVALRRCAALVPVSRSTPALAALAFAATLVARAQTFRGEHVAAGSWRDYVTLTKPRIMTLLLLTGACGMVVGARGLPSHALFVGDDGRARPRLRRRERAEPRSRRGHRPPDGQAHEAAAGCRRTDRRRPRARVRPDAERVLVRPAREHRQRAHRRLALAGNLFYVLVYTRWLKRSTPQNIVIGGAAGAVPPLVGWAAATGNLTVPALSSS